MFGVFIILGMALLRSDDTFGEVAEDGVARAYSGNDGPFFEGLYQSNKVALNRDVVIEDVSLDEVFLGHVLVVAAILSGLVRNDGLLKDGVVLHVRPRWFEVAACTAKISVRWVLRQRGAVHHLLGRKTDGFLFSLEGLGGLKSADHCESIGRPALTLIFNCCNRRRNYIFPVPLREESVAFLLELGLWDRWKFVFLTQGHADLIGDTQLPSSHNIRAVLVLFGLGLVSPLQGLLIVRDCLLGSGIIRQEPQHLLVLAVGPVGHVVQAEHPRLSHHVLILYVAQAFLEVGLACAVLFDASVRLLVHCQVGDVGCVRLVQCAERFFVHNEHVKHLEGAGCEEAAADDDSFPVGHNYYIKL